MNIRAQRIVLAFLSLILASFASGEGTRELLPDSTGSGAGLYIDNSAFSVYTKFAVINCPANYRLYIHVKSPGESILFGLKSTVSGLQFNLRKPDGTIAMSGICPSAPGQTGFIRYYNQAIVGPFPNLGGYQPLVHSVTNPADTGDYYFELSNASTYAGYSFDYWDFQVVSGQHTPAIPADRINGRVWSKSWQFYADLGNYVFQPFNGRVYVYSDDGIVTKLAFSNAHVGAVTIFCNPYGCLNTGNFTTDRQSMNYNTFNVFPGIAQYKVFLNDPDSVVYPSGFFGQITGTPYMIPDPNFPPCSGNKQIIVNVNKSGKVDILITFPYGGPATNVNILSPVIPGTNAIPWNGKDGQGNPVPDGTPVTVHLNFVNGLTNLPVWDQERNPDGYVISLVRPVSAAGIVPQTFWDDSPVAQAPGTCYYSVQTSNLTGCSPGSITGYPGCHPWVQNGPDCHDRMINTWWYGSTSTADFTTIFTSTPVNPVGHNGSQCGPGRIILHATVPSFATVDWYDVPSGGTPLLSGDTSFLTPFITVTTTYFAEGRNLISNCLSAARVPVTATVLPVPSPTVTGPDHECAGNSALYVTEPGMFNYTWSVTSGGTITGGSGTNVITVLWNAPGPQSITVNYSNAIGCMAQYPAVIRIDIDSPPGPAGVITGPSPVCKGNQATYSVPLIPNAFLYEWTVPVGVEIITGAGSSAITVLFTDSSSSGPFIVHGSNYCGNGLPSPPFFVAVNEPAFADAGSDTVLCQGSVFTLTGASAAHYTRIEWTTNGTGVLTNGTTLVPTYTPLPEETGDVMLSLFAEGISPCPSDTSSMILHLVPSPAAEAGEGLSGCDLQPVLIAGSSATGYTTLSWTSSGTGKFSDPSVLHPVYYPSPEDTINGTVALTLTAVAPAPCPSASDPVFLILNASPFANAGPDSEICSGEIFTPAMATAGNAASVTWETAGDGNFSDIHALHPSYSPGSGDIQAGSVLLTLYAAPQGTCLHVSDVLFLRILPGPSAMAGPGGALCSSSSIRIAGAAAGNYDSLRWSHNGTGILSNGTVLAPEYFPGTGELGTVLLSLKVYGLPPCNDTWAESTCNLTVYSDVTADAGPGQSIPFDSVAILSGEGSGGSGNYSYSWQPEDLLENPAVKDPVTLRLTRDTTFSLMVKDNATGCTGYDTVRVSVNRENPDVPECIHVYNVITPNGDGTNDTWIIDCIGSYPENSVTIFNRWGDRVITIDNYDNATQAWKGTNSRGDLLPDGTYFYILTVRDQKTIKGWVYIRSGSK